MKKAVCLSLCIVLLLGFFSCSATTPDKNFISGNAEFSLDLLQSCNAGSGENIIISPASVMIALAMTANGAAGETQSEMLETICNGLTLDELNEFIQALVDGLPDDEKCKVKFADSIWFRDDADRLTVENIFIDNSKTKFNTEIFKEPFDSSTLRKINDWTKENTDGKIEEILSGIPVEAVMYLINAVAFDAKWENAFNEKLTSKNHFNENNGNKTLCDFMISAENSYIELNNAKGFAKDYAEGRYQFIALLPDVGTTLSDFVSGLDGKALASITDKAKNREVDVYIPKFTVKYKNELTDELKALGMELAFDSEKADFSAMAKSSNGNIYIGLVQHKAFIEINEAGTKASAATVVGIYNEGSAVTESRLSLTFNRPFVYMIMDTQTDIPLFIGTFETASES